MINNEIMLDLETLGTGLCPAILSIGAVRFDNKGVHDSIEIVIDLQSCLGAGMRVDADTMLWWMNQPDESRKLLSRPGVSLPAALKQFAAWVDEAKGVWGNGSDFDNAILADAYMLCDMPVPWRHGRNRCYRTMKNMFDKVPMKRVGTHHNAVDDAKSQALHLIDIMAAI